MASRGPGGLETVKMLVYLKLKAVKLSGQFTGFSNTERQNLPAVFSFASNRFNAKSF